MNDSPNSPDADSGASFADLVEASLAERDADLSVGDKVSGKIVAFDGENLVIDTGTKLDGVASKVEFLDAEGDLTVAEGDTVELYVVSLKNDEVVLSKALDGVGGFEMLSEAFERQLPVNGVVKASRKGGFDVDVLHRRAFCPVSQIDEAYVENPETYVGASFEFLITTLERGGKNIVVSRRKLLARDREEAEAKFVASVKPGDTLSARITRLAGFGAFAEISPGVEGLIHISELSFSRLATPEDAVAVGDVLPVVITAIETDKKGRLRISLSAKKAAADPWDTVDATVKAGEKTTGRVTRLADFGAFVEIAPGIEGLVHISEMSYAKRVNRPEEIVSQGQIVPVLVKDVDKVKKRVSLSLRDVEGDPFGAAAEKYKPGATVAGTVEKRQTFGFFINLEPGVTGLLPASKLRDATDPTAFEKLKPGDAVTVTVIELDLPGRKITLAPAGARESEDWKNHAAKSDRPMGLLGEKLAAAMAGKNGK